MWSRSRSLIVACVVAALVIPLGRLEAQAKPQTTTVTEPDGVTVEIVTESMSFPDNETPVKIELPRGTTATRADGSEVTFRMGGTITVPPQALRGLLQSTSSATSGAQPSTRYWAVLTLVMQVAGQPLMTVTGPFLNDNMCESALSGMLSNIKDQSLLDHASTGCRGDVSVVVPYDRRGPVHELPCVRPGCKTI
jgi:hypothetical protein